MTLFEWWSIPRKAWIIIVAELSVIVGLSSSVISTYFNDVYFQNYVNGLAPIFIPVVSVGFGVASASTATVLYFRMRNLRGLETATREEDMKPRGQKHAARRTTPSDTSAGRNGTVAIQGSRLRPLTPGGPSPGRGSTTASVEKKDSSP